MMNTTHAFTGHRPKKLSWKYDKGNSRCLALKAELATQTAKLVRRIFSAG